jgi:hypothetical protein
LGLQRRFISKAFGVGCVRTPRNYSAGGFPDHSLEVILKIIGEITIPALRAGMVISPDVF